jgi:hypothetical protein
MSCFNLCWANSKYVPHESLTSAVLKIVVNSAVQPVRRRLLLATHGKTLSGIIGFASGENCSAIRELTGARHRGICSR